VKERQDHRDNQDRPVSSLFLFGAGASAYSGECYPKQPPLGKDLFQELQCAGGVASTVDRELAEQFSDFERGMAAFRVKRDIDTTEFLRDMARYFAVFEPGEDNYYVTLIRRIVAAREVATFATLNYDLLIEHATAMAGWQVAYHAAPPPGNLCVLKLHGSCNFLPELGNRAIRGIKFQAGNAGCIVNAPIYPASSAAEVFEFCAREDSIAPALALYAPGKAILYCRDAVLELQAMWRHEVKRARRIFIVGVRPNPEDAHVWQPLARGKTPIWYVGPEWKMMADWVADEKRTQVFHAGEDFGDCVPTILSKLRTN
jgi:hypothetical protein